MPTKTHIMIFIFAAISFNASHFVIAQNNSYIFYKNSNSVMGLALDKKENLYILTNKGDIFSVTAQKKTKQIYSGLKTGGFSWEVLTVFPDGTIYTIDNIEKKNHLIKIDQKGTKSEIMEIPEEVTSLTSNAGGDLYLGVWKSEGNLTLEMNPSRITAAENMWGEIWHINGSGEKNQIYKGGIPIALSFTSKNNLFCSIWGKQGNFRAENGNHSVADPRHMFWIMLDRDNQVLKFDEKRNQVLLTDSLRAVSSLLANENNENYAYGIGSDGESGIFLLTENKAPGKLIFFDKNMLKSITSLAVSGKYFYIGNNDGFVYRIPLAIIKKRIVDVNTKTIQETKISVSSVRSWDIFDGELPQMNNDEHWYLENSNLESSRFPKDTPPDLVLVEGDFTVSLNDEVKGSISFKKFSSDEHNGIPPAKGQYYEIVLFFENDGNKSTSITVSNKDKKTLNLKMSVKDKSEIQPAAFRLPGFQNNVIANTSLFTAVNGLLAISLQPGDKTWLLVVFDIPKDIKAADLVLGSTSLGNIQLQNKNNTIDRILPKPWEDNCTAINAFKDLKFSILKTWKENDKKTKTIYLTNRSALLKIFESFKLEKILKKKMISIIEIIKKAPLNKQKYILPGSNEEWFDVVFDGKQFNQFNEFISDIEKETQNHVIKCNEKS